MPKLELEVFNGNPLKYHQFAKAFDQNVDKVTSDSDNIYADRASPLQGYKVNTAKFPECWGHGVL